MDQVQKAAVILLGMGEQKAANVLKYMDPSQVEKIVLNMSKMGRITQDEIQRTLNEFGKVSENQTTLGVDSAQYIRNALVDAVGVDKASNIIDRALDDGDSGIASLCWQDANAIVSLIREEHPQIIAVILTYLDSEKAAEVIHAIPKEMQRDIMRRVASQGSISHTALQELKKMVEEKSKEVRTFKTNQSGGAKLAANIINFMSPDEESEMIKDIEEYDKELCEKIQEHIFPFENLASVDSKSLQNLLRSASSDTLVMALKGVDEKVRDTLLSNMSGRAADMIRDDLEAKGPVPLSEVISAQKEIIGVAQRMAKNGEIMLGGKGDDMVK